MPIANPLTRPESGLNVAGIRISPDSFKCSLSGSQLTGIRIRIRLQACSGIWFHDIRARTLLVACACRSVPVTCKSTEVGWSGKVMLPVLLERPLEGAPCLGFSCQLLAPFPPVAYMAEGHFGCKWLRGADRAGFNLRPCRPVPRSAGALWSTP